MKFAWPSFIDHSSVGSAMNMAGMSDEAGKVLVRGLWNDASDGFAESAGDGIP